MNTTLKRTRLSTQIAILAAAASLSAVASAGEHSEAPGYEDKDQAVHEQMEKSQHHQEQVHEQERYSEPSMKNAWLHGKLETALLLNRHLNNFTIDSDVKGNKAILQGTVESEVDRELAEQVALSIKGIESVDNQLKVDMEEAKENREERERDHDDDADRSFSQTFDDLTTTAVVKSKLLANGSTGGLSINVDTMNGVVILKGEVETSEEKDLAQSIAENVDGVVEVNNMLEVKS